MKIDSNDRSFNPNFSSDSGLSTNFSSLNNRLSLKATSPDSHINMQFDSDQEMNVIFELTGGGSSDSKVYYGSTTYWNSHPDIIGKRGCIYIYSDWYTDPEYGKVAGLKVGDGETPLIEIAATDQMWQDHINDMVRHITQAEREYWNNKVTCEFIAELEQLVFSK